MIDPVNWFLFLWLHGLTPFIWLVHATYSLHLCFLSLIWAKFRYLKQADVELTLLHYKIRLSRDLNLLQLGSYEHASRLIDEVGRLLGGQQKKTGISGAKAP